MLPQANQSAEAFVMENDVNVKMVWIIGLSIFKLPAVSDPIENILCFE